MASLTKKTEGWQTGFRLRVCTGGKRLSVWLGPIRDREAMAVKIHVEAIIASQRMQTPLPAETARWLKELPAELRHRLRDVLGVAKNVDEAVDAYVTEMESQLKQESLRAQADTLDQFAADFGSHQLRSLTGAVIDQWLRERNVAESTVGKHAKNLRTWLAWCREKHYCDADLKVGTPSTIGVGHKEFVPLDEFQRVIDFFVHDPEMQCVLALSRWSGLRMPSEAVTLRRSAIDFENNRLRIDDSKRTQRRSRGPPKIRELPLFSGILPYIEPMMRLPRGPHDFLLPTLGGSDAARTGSLLRNRVYRALDKLGMPRWPKVFHSPRATRETELMEVVGPKAASVWIGNSAAVAVRNYELVRGETWAKALDV